MYSAVEEKPLDAIVRTTFGSPEQVLRLEAVPKPMIKDDEVLIKVHASSTNAGDWLYLTGDPFIVRLMAGPFGPRHQILGRDVAGVIEAVGKDVTAFAAGDEVYGEIEFGAWAEYAVAPVDVIARKPANLSFEQAAAVPLTGTTALQGLRDRALVQPGEKVLINGASGGVGTLAVQIAKALGADVSAVASTGHAELLRSLGADQVIDYTQQDVARSAERYDVIFDIAGRQPVSALRRLLTADGRYLPVGGPVGRLLRAGLGSMVPGNPVVVVSASPNRSDLESLTELIEAGSLTPVIENTYPLRDVAQAMRLQGKGHAGGKRVIAM
jgi:NADPH:quinone reductase-like Zn-dependent oxidoreductase